MGTTIPYKFKFQDNRFKFSVCQLDLDCSAIGVRFLLFESDFIFTLEEIAKYMDDFAPEKKRFMIDQVKEVVSSRVGTMGRLTANLKELLNFMIDWFGPNWADHHAGVWIDLQDELHSGFEYGVMKQVRLSAGEPPEFFENVYGQFVSYALQTFPLVFSSAFDMWLSPKRLRFLAEREKQAAVEPISE